MLLFDKSKINEYRKSDFDEINRTYDIRPPRYFSSLEKLRQFYKNLNWTELEIRRKTIIEKRMKQNQKFKEKTKMIKAAKEKTIEKKKKEEQQIERKKNASCLERSMTELRDYQKNVVRFLTKNDRLLVYHKMGTGKTLTAVTASQCYLDTNPQKKVIVITPASLLDNFKKAMRQYKLINHANNYEFYSIDEARNRLKEGELNCRNSMVIVDEVHNYRTKLHLSKNKEEIKSGSNILFGYKCFLRAEKLLLLTGTPIYNRPDDLNVYKVLLNYDKKELEKNKIKRDLVDIVKYYSKKPITSFRGKVSVHDFEKNDADFPKRIDIDKKIAMKEVYEKEYFKILKLNHEALKKVFPTWTESNENQFENLMRRATQNIDNDLNLNKKLHKAIDHINRIESMNKNLADKDKYKMIIYSQFIDHGILLIKNQIGSIRHQIISGGTKKSERQNIVNYYNQGKIQILFITKAGGEGLDLKGTDIVMILEPTWNQNTSEQIIARAIRFKSHEDRAPERKKVKVIHLIHTTFEDRKAKTQQKIEQTIEKTKKKIPSLKSMKFIQSCDLLISKFQKVKQKVLNYYDKQLKSISIENELVKWQKKEKLLNEIRMKKIRQKAIAVKKRIDNSKKKKRSRFGSRKQSKSKSKSSTEVIDLT